MGQVDGAGSEVDESHRDALPLQSGKLIEVYSAELEVVDEVVWFRTAQGEGEVLLVEQSDLLLQAGKQKRSGRTSAEGCKYNEVETIQGGVQFPVHHLDRPRQVSSRSCVMLFSLLGGTRVFFMIRI